ncbi:MAG: SAM-dependent methyltransferase [Jatrophihabitantaceae bacterium]
MISDHLDAHEGPSRVLSLCAGDGRDVIGVLRQREDSARVHGTLVELHSDIAQRARDAAAGLDLVVRTADAAETASYADAIPADLVLLVGIFGNISAEDLEHTVAASPALCTRGATLVWTRGRRGGDCNDAVRARFEAAGFTELEYATSDLDGLPAVGAVRYQGPPVTPSAERLFTFLR